jgi:hypothetical protein
MCSESRSSMHNLKNWFHLTILCPVLVSPP